MPRQVKKSISPCVSHNTTMEESSSNKEKLEQHRLSQQRYALRKQLLNQGISLETVQAIVPKKKPSSVKKLGRPPVANPRPATLRSRRRRAREKLEAQQQANTSAMSSYNPMNLFYTPKPRPAEDVAMEEEDKAQAVLQSNIDRQFELKALREARLAKVEEARLEDDKARAMTEEARLKEAEKDEQESGVLSTLTQSLSNSIARKRELSTVKARRLASEDNNDLDLGIKPAAFPTPRKLPVEHDDVIVGRGEEDKYAYLDNMDNEELIEYMVPERIVEFSKMETYRALIASKDLIEKAGRKGGFRRPVLYAFVKHMDESGMEEFDDYSKLKTKELAGLLVDFLARSEVEDDEAEPEPEIEEPDENEINQDEYAYLGGMDRSEFLGYATAERIATCMARKALRMLAASHWRHKLLEEATRGCRGTFRKPALLAFVKRLNDLRLTEFDYSGRVSSKDLAHMLIDWLEDNEDAE